MPASDSYQLFRDPTENNKIPVNTLRDEFIYGGFAPLFVRDGPNVGPAVIPRDAVHPELMRDLHEKIFPHIPYKVPIPVLKGGIPLVPEWEEVFDPPPEPSIKGTKPEELEIDDLDDFLDNPRVKVGDRNVKVDLTPNKIDELMEFGSSYVPVGKDKVVLIKVSEPEVIDTVEAPATVAVDDVGEFMRNPELTSPSGETFSVELTPDNVGELTRFGVTRVHASRGRRSVEFYVTDGARGEQPAGTGRTRPRALPMVIATGTGAVTPAGVYGRYTGSKASLSPTPYTTVPKSVIEQTIKKLALPIFEFVVYLPFRQTWELLGYSRGELLNSISLAPLEETTVEIFTWDRVKQTRDDSFLIEQEASMDVGFTDKLSTEVVKELSSEFNWKVAHNGEVSVPLQYVSIKAGHDIELGGKLKETNKTTQQALSEAVRKASSRFRATRQTKVTESREFGTETRITRRLKNSNMCHTLNLDYFELLATYEVTTQLLPERARLCVLTPAFVSDVIDSSFLMTYEGALKEALLSKTYESGFEAARKIAAWQRLCAIKCRLCECERPPAAVKEKEKEKEEEEREPAANPAQQALDAAKADIEKAAQALYDAVGRLQSSTATTICSKANDVGGELNSLIPQISIAGITVGTTKEQKAQHQQEWQDAKAEYHRWLYRKGVEALELTLWNRLVDFNTTKDSSPEAMERLIDAAGLKGLDVLNAATFASRSRGKIIEIIAELVRSGCLMLQVLTDNIGFDDAGLDPAFAQARRAVEAYRTAKTAASVITPAEPKKKEIEDIVEKAKETARTFELTDYTAKEIAEAQVAERALLAHIQANESYYRQAIWRSTDPADRFRLLSLLGDLNKYVDNEVVGFVGGAAALPFRLDYDPDIRKWFKTNVWDNSDLEKPTEVVTVTVPTKGVTLEARLGEAEACEDFIVEQRRLNLRQKEAEVRSAEERAKQEELETKRYQKRLAVSPARLDDPDPNERAGAVHVVLHKENEP